MIKLLLVSDFYHAFCCEMTISEKKRKQKYAVPTQINSQYNISQ